MKWLFGTQVDPVSSPLKGAGQLNTRSFKNAASEFDRNHGQSQANGVSHAADLRSVVLRIRGKTGI
jgi:hypothetical protein